MRRPNRNHLWGGHFHAVFSIHGGELRGHQVLQEFNKKIEE